MNGNHPNKLKPLVKIVARIIKDDPRTLYDIDDAQNPLSLLHAKLSQVIPGYNDKEHCLNCGASMAEYTETFDVNDAMLLINMGKRVRADLSAGEDFTEANKVHVTQVETINHTQKCRTTKCSKLGLIAKSDKHRWAITTRGWEALRGEKVPKMRTTYRGKIIERQSELTTIREVFEEHRAKVIDLETRKKKFMNDYRGDALTYEPREWYEISGYHEGAIV